MTEPPDPESLPLDCTVRSTPQHRLSLGGRILLGFLGYGLLCAMLAGVASQARLAAHTVFVTWLIMTTVLFALAIYLRIRYRYSGIGYGMILSLLTAAMLAVFGVVYFIASSCFGDKTFRVN